MIFNVQFDFRLYVGVIDRFQVHVGCIVNCLVTLHQYKQLLFMFNVTFR